MRKFREKIQFDRFSAAASIYFKHKIRNLLTEHERLPHDRFTRGWCQMKGNNPYICTIYLRFRYMDENIKKGNKNFLMVILNGKKFLLGSSSDISSGTLTRPI
jgi:hypothetical protein